jgi:hypothetical protein
MRVGLAEGRERVEQSGSAGVQVTQETAGNFALAVVHPLTDKLQSRLLIWSA